MRLLEVELIFSGAVITSITVTSVWDESQRKTLQYDIFPKWELEGALLY